MTPDQINDFFSFLSEGRIGAVTYWLRLIAGVITSALVAAIVVIAIQFRQLMVGKKETPAVPESSSPPPALVSRPWQEVMRKIESPSPADWNLAVIQADSIFDGVTKDMGLAGLTLGERLRNLDASKLQSLNDLWEAHKMRNRIVHETDRVLTHEEARRAVVLFERGLRELQYLEG